MTSFLEYLSSASNKGALLEQIVEDILLDDSSLHNVQRQKGGSQYGFDLVALHKESDGINTCWKYECKNLRDGSSIADIAPKLIWHTNTPIHKFIIISPFGISNDLRHLLEQHRFCFSIEVWDGEYLEYRAASSRKAALRLSSVNLQSNLTASCILFPGKNFEIDFYCPYGDKPFEFDYFLDGQALKMAYALDSFYLTIAVHNVASSPLTIDQILIKTITYKEPRGRVLRQRKLKGLVETTQLTFELKSYPNGETSALPPAHVFLVNPGKQEYLNLWPSSATTGGYYEFYVELTGRLHGNPFSIHSDILSLFAKSESIDSKVVYVLGKFYDTPVPHILQLPDEQWGKLTHDSDMMQSLEGDGTWKIIGIDGDPEKIIELGIPVEDELFSMQQLMERMMKANPHLGQMDV